MSWVLLMNVFRFVTDDNYKDLTFLQKDDVRLFSTFTGQKITLDWNEVWYFRR